jgi:hypothetical protein
MTKNLRKTALVAGASAVLVLVPAGVAFAAGNGNGPHPNGDPAATCTYDQQRQHLRLQDGTGPRHDQMQTGSTTGVTPGGHQSGPMDGTGPQADRPLDGTGNQWGRG